MCDEFPHMEDFPTCGNYVEKGVTLVKHFTGNIL